MCGHCTDTIVVILLSLQGQTKFVDQGVLRHSGGCSQVRGFFIHSLRFSAEFLVMSPQPLFGLQGSSARELRRPALALTVVAHVQHVSRCVLRLPVRRSTTCFLQRYQHTWRLKTQLLVSL